MDVDIDARRFVDHLCAEGIDKTVEPDPDRDNIDSLPDWFEPEKYKRAQKYYRANVFAILSSIVIGGIAVLADPPLRRLLQFAGNMSSPVLVYQRVVPTVLHMILWYESELSVGSPPWRSLQSVRKVHGRVSQRARSSSAGSISQKDMAVTQLYLAGYGMLAPTKLGVPVSVDDFEALAHFWRLVGYMMNVRDDFNLFAGDSWPQIEARIRLVHQELILPNMEPQPDDRRSAFYHMADQYCTGLWAFNPLMTTASFVYFARYVNGCVGYSGPNPGPIVSTGAATSAQLDWQQMSAWDRAMVRVHCTVHGRLLQYALGRWFFGRLIAALRWLTVEAPVFGVWQFGWRRAFVRKV